MKKIPSHCAMLSSRKTASPLCPSLKPSFLTPTTMSFASCLEFYPKEKYIPNDGEKENRE
jgi:hypothetical protein